MNCRRIDVLVASSVLRQAAGPVAGSFWPAHDSTYHRTVREAELPERFPQAVLAQIDVRAASSVAGFELLLKADGKPFGGYGNGLLWHTSHKQRVCSQNGSPQGHR